MEKFFVVVFTLCIFCIAAGANIVPALQCSTDTLQKDVESTVMSCMMHDFELMLKMIKYINHPMRMVQVDFVCKNTKDVAKLLDCMIKKFAGKCLPKNVVDVTLKVLPTEKEWLDILKFGCANQEMLGQQCMSPQDSKNFLKCYLGKLNGMTATMVSASSSHNMDPMLCEARKMDEICLAENKGSCSTAYIEMAMKLLEMIVKVPDCGGLTAADLKENALSSLLLHGQPLVFQPEGDAKSVKYN